jgi:hypothetical protein
VRIFTFGKAVTNSASLSNKQIMRINGAVKRKKESEGTPEYAAKALEAIRLRSFLTLRISAPRARRLDSNASNIARD